MADLTALQAIAAKLSTDISAKVAADKAASDAKDATIADLTAKLAAANTDQTGVDAVTTALTTLDGTLA